MSETTPFAVAETFRLRHELAMRDVEIKRLKAQVRELAEDLADFRHFSIKTSAVRTLDGSHHNPMWVRIAETLAKHGMNDTDGYIRPPQQGHQP